MSSCSRAFLLAGLLALTALSCVDDPATTSDNNSGIDATITIGPMCPVEVANTPCPDEPYQATIVVLDESGEEVARVDSGEDGRLRLPLDPGRYTLVPQSPAEGGLPFASDLEVDVKEHAFTAVTIEYDSGVR